MRISGGTRPILRHVARDQRTGRDTTWGRLPRLKDSLQRRIPDLRPRENLDLSGKECTSEFHGYVSAQLQATVGRNDAPFEGRS